MRQNLRGDRHEGLHACIFEDRKQHDEPEGQGEVADRAQSDDAALHFSDVALSVGLVRDRVFFAEVPVEEKHGDCAQEGEQRDDRADPQSPSVGAQILCNNIRSGLASELCEVSDAPAYSSVSCDKGESMGMHTR